MTQEFYSQVYKQEKKLHIMFIVALFLTTKNCKQFKCPSTDEWIYKMYYIHTIEQSLAIKSTKIVVNATKLMNLKKLC